MRTETDPIVEPEPTGPRHLAPRKRRRFRRPLLILLGVLIVVAVILGVYLNRQINPSSTGSDVQLTVPKGASTADIAKLLEHNGVIDNATVFRLYVRVKGVGTFQAGDYTLRRHKPYGQIVATMRKGAEVSVDRITIPEGFTLEQIAGRVGRLPGRTAQRFLQLAGSGEIRSQFSPPGSTNLEGVRDPNTYFVSPTDDERAILQRMVTGFEQEANGMGITDAATRLGLSPYEVVTVASMVEREAKVDVDRGKVASVIYNRLRQHIKLGIDATLIYGLHGDSVEAGKRPNQPNPYNTRIIAGLPPTPIASPGKASLQAAIAPEQTDFLYYVLADKDGHHAFTASPSEFNRLVAEARKKGLL